MGVIYCARNTINGLMYIGKTSRSMIARKDEHITESKQAKTYFHKAIAKYGPLAFTWLSLESSDDNKTLDDLEKEYIDMFSTSIRGIGYNTTHGGDGVINNAESLAKMSKTKKGKPSPMRGKHFSSDAVKNMRASRIGIWVKHVHPRLGAHLSAESIAKIIQTKKSNPGYDIECKNCGNVFTARVSFALYCSNNCKLRYFRRKDKTQ